jgi:hypothetical protein
MQARFSLCVMLTATAIGLTAHPAQAQVFQSEGIYASPLNQSFSNIYQYPESSPGQSHSNIYQYPTVYPQPVDRQPVYVEPGYGQPRIIYQQPSVIYRRTEIISPDGNRRVILEDPQYVIPNNGVIINPDRVYRHHHHRESNRYRRSNNRIYYRF